MLGANLLERDIDGICMLRCRKGASPVKNLMARGTGESPQKLRGRLAGREAERRDEEDEERDAKSRDLMRDSELALAEVSLNTVPVLCACRLWA